MKKSIALVLGLGIFACNFSTLAKQVKMSAPVLFLGSGYTSYDQMGTGVSALNLSDPLKVTYSNRQRTFSFDSDISRSDVAKALNVSIDAKANWSSFSADLSAEFVRNIKDTDYGANYSFADSFTVDEQLNTGGIYGINALLPAAQAAYRSPPPTFTGRYGDQFITGLSAGGMLLIDVQLKFNSHEDKQKFTASLDSRIGSFGTLSAALEKTEEQLDTQGSIRISGYQLGGDISQLPRAFVGGTKEGDGYYILNCSLQDLNACNGILHNILMYDYNPSDPSDPHTFSGQIHQEIPLSGKPEASKLAPLGHPVIDTYVNLGLRAPAPKPDGLVDARAQISGLYDKLTTDKMLLTHLQSSAVASLMDGVTLKSLSDSVDNALSEFNPLTNDPMVCYSHGQESKCVDVAKNITIAVNEDLPPSALQKLYELHTAYALSCSQSDPNPWLNIYTGAHYIVYPVTPGFSMNGQFTMSSDKKTLYYVGTVVSGGSGNVGVRGTLNLNGNNVYQGPIVDGTGKTGFCGSADAYVQPIINPA